MEQSIVILVMGVTGSGKTTVGSLLAKRLNFLFVDGDDFHSEANRAKMHSGQPLTDEDRKPWLELLAAKIKTWLEQEVNVVLACSALREAYRETLIADEKERIPILLLSGSFELFHERLAKRNHPFMNKELLQSQFDTLEKPADAIYLDASLTKEEVVDAAVKELGPWLTAGEASGVHS
jgi:gluconokinase